MSRSLPRLYTPQPLAAGQTLELEEAQAHYLSRVLRLRVADEVLLFNGGADGEWRAEITDIGKKSCSVTLRERLRPQAPEPDLWLCFAPVKNVRTDFIAQKATELGVSALQPVMTARTIASRVNTERLQANAIEAAEQCERMSVPQVREPLNLHALLDSWPAGRHILFCDESGSGRPIMEALANASPSGRGRFSYEQSELENRVRAPSPGPAGHPLPEGEGIAAWAVFIGPEGGFTPEEAERLRAMPHVTAASLGPRILRADTAAIAAISCWQAVLGNWAR